jgi:hypothetical protein
VHSIRGWLLHNRLIVQGEECFFDCSGVLHFAFAVTRSLTAAGDEFSSEPPT